MRNSNFTNGKWNDIYMIIVTKQCECGMGTGALKTIFISTELPRQLLVFISENQSIAEATRALIILFLQSFIFLSYLAPIPNLVWVNVWDLRITLITLW